MRYLMLAGVLLVPVTLSFGYIEAPHTLGRCVQESSNIVLMEVEKISRDKNLIIFKKVQDIKGKHPEGQIKHNIGKRGFHPREWQNIMTWAEEGKKAVFFYNGGASETCIGTYWYQCYREGDWWGLSHAEPFLLRTFYGDVDKLTAAVSTMLQGKEVVVSCLADGPKEQLHQRKGKLQMLKASLKLMDYNPRRDFLAWGSDDGVDIPEFKTVILLPESSPDWRFIPAKLGGAVGNRWQASDFDAAAWQQGKAPIGYGEDELGKRQGTIIAEKGQPFFFRKEFQVPTELLKQKDVTFRVSVASDDNAAVYLNGQLVDQDQEADHEFTYWNREVEVPVKHFLPGRNVVAAFVKNGPSSSDLYLDMEVAALIPVPKKVIAKAAKEKLPMIARVDPAKPPRLPDDRFPPDLLVDKKTRMVSLPCAVAPRKLPHLKEIYPIEVMATYPAPQGQKAHETVVTFAGIKPSMVHRALVELGLTPGKPARGEGGKATGPELQLLLEFASGGKTQRLPIENVLAGQAGGKPLLPLRWHFTGSVFRQADPEKDDYVYGADLTGTLITLFPVTDDTVIQSSLGLADETGLRLDVRPGILPREGTPAKLIIQVK